MCLVLISCAGDQKPMAASLQRRFSKSNKHDSQGITCLAAYLFCMRPAEQSIKLKMEFYSEFTTVTAQGQLELYDVMEEQS
jgi:hypothetical protein